MGLLLLLVTGCGRELISKELPSSQDLGEPRGYKVARTIIHSHTSFSYDACDNSIEKTGTVSGACNQEVRRALCFNRVDFAFFTDHPWAMTEYEFPDLMLYESGDSLEFDGANPYMNSLGNCGQYLATAVPTPRVLVGYESSVLMPVGMKKHIGGTSEERLGLYKTPTLSTMSTLRTQAGARILVPHTEEQDMDQLYDLGVDGIEVYNFHANMDPKRREHALGLRPYRAIFNFLPYLLDFAGQEQPDLAFVSIFEYAAVYGERWDSLLARGLKVMGFGGSDSHQNTVKNSARDRERLDAHRRLLRWMSNHFLVTDHSYAGIMEALEKSRGWVVFEGLGSPENMDFYARVAGVNTSVGDTTAFVAGQTSLHIPLPKLSNQSPQKKLSPEIRIRLYRVKSDGVKELVATSTDEPLDVIVSQAGIYRAEVSIVPHHLRWYIVSDAELTSEEFPWIVTNPIYLE